jgi:RNA polymerase sigma-70 factor, ECF subfamily
MKQSTDDDILQQCQQGNREAFNILVRVHQERIYWTIRRLVGDADEAYDIAQEVFIKAWHGIGDFRGDAQVFTWLYRIAVNLSINHVRKRKIRSFVGLDAIEILPEDRTLEPDRSVESDEMKAIIDKAVQTLPEKQKAVFILRYYQELSYEEIAGIMHRTVGGLKANYFHAVRKIEEYVKHAV